MDFPMGTVYGNPIGLFPFIIVNKINGNRMLSGEAGQSFPDFIAVTAGNHIEIHYFCLHNCKDNAFDQGGPAQLNQGFAISFIGQPASFSCCL